MSYILDALRKADAQRERDPGRGIHAQAVALAGASPRGRLGGAKRLWIAGSLLIAALLLAAGWYVSRRDPAPPASTVAARAPSNAPTPSSTKRPTAVSDAVPAQTPPPAQRIDPPAEQTTTAARGLLRTQLAQNDPTMGQPRTARGAAAAGGAQGAAPTEAAPAAPATPPPPTPPLPAPTMPAPAAPAPTAPAPAAPAPPAPPVPASVPTPPTPGLPPDAPKVAISGGVYSASRAQRMLIVNGQVFNEGSEIATGVTIEEIKARSVVLKFRGTRYTIGY
jgi:general secretion pathway protein B